MGGAVFAQKILERRNILMDILRIWYEGDDARERAKIYHNIDPASITITNGKMYFAHPGTWDAKMISNRYQIPLDRLSTVSTDPEWIKGYCETHENVINRELYISKKEVA